METADIIIITNINHHHYKASTPIIHIFKTQKFWKIIFFPSFHKLIWDKPALKWQGTTYIVFIFLVSVNIDKILLWSIDVLPPYSSKSVM